uniref:ShKT domain-containing protein n=1 Tax=Panagrolaimus sp. ES5 TaxID=591445 RepID=A0AC34F1T8_9BILA
MDGVTPYDAIAETLVSESCFDRYGGAFCQRYVNSTDVWSQKHWSCSGQSPHISFRSCRQSCGYCDFDKVIYTLQNALDSCKHNINKDAWKERLRRRLFVEKLNKTLP